MKHLYSITVFFLLAQWIFAQSEPVLICAIPSVDGNNITVDIEVQNFQDIISYQFALVWKEGDFEFGEITNLNQILPDLDDLNFGPVFTNSAGTLNSVRTLWFGPFTGVSLENGSTLFSATFTKLHEEAVLDFSISGDEEIDIEVANSNAVEVEVISDNESCGIVSNTNNPLNPLNSAKMEFAISPNPSIGPIIIEFNVNFTGLIEVIRIDGKVIATEEIVNRNRYSMDLTRLNNGPYFIRAISDKINKVTRKLIIAK